MQLSFERWNESTLYFDHQIFRRLWPRTITTISAPRSATNLIEYLVKSSDIRFESLRSVLLKCHNWRWIDIQNMGRIMRPHQIHVDSERSSVWPAGVGCIWGCATYNWTDLVTNPEEHCLRWKPNLMHMLVRLRNSVRCAQKPLTQTVRVWHGDNISCSL